jgi:hypothetical protein
VAEQERLAIVRHVDDWVEATDEVEMMLIELSERLFAHLELCDADRFPCGSRHLKQECVGVAEHGQAVEVAEPV